MQSNTIYTLSNTVMEWFEIEEKKQNFLGYKTSALLFLSGSMWQMY